MTPEKPAEAPRTPVESPGTLAAPGAAEWSAVAFREKELLDLAHAEADGLRALLELASQMIDDLDHAGVGDELRDRIRSALTPRWRP